MEWKVEIVLRKASFIVLLTLLAVHSVSAQTQLEMNRQACDASRDADRRLSVLYARILKEYASDREFVANLKASQRAWVAYRDAEMKVIYPEREPGYYGSVQPLCECGERKALTESRMKELRRWVRGSEEGDVCAGSVRVKQG